MGSFTTDTEVRMQFSVFVLGILILGSIHTALEVEFAWECWDGSGFGTKERSLITGIISVFTDFKKLTEEVFGEDLARCYFGKTGKTFLEFKEALASVYATNRWTARQRDDGGTPYGFYACKVRSEVVVDNDIRTNLLNITDPSIEVQVVVRQCTGVQDVVQDMVSNGVTTNNNILYSVIILASLLVICIR